VIGKVAQGEVSNFSGGDDGCGSNWWCQHPQQLLTSAIYLVDPINFG
jgi:hypothetical protein